MVRMLFEWACDERGQLHIDYLMISLCAAVLAGGMWQALAGTPGQQMKGTVQSGIAVYSNAFEGGARATMPDVTTVTTRSHGLGQQASLVRPGHVVQRAITKIRGVVTQATRLTSVADVVRVTLSLPRWLSVFHL